MFSLREIVNMFLISKLRHSCETHYIYAKSSHQKKKKKKKKKKKIKKKGLLAIK